MGHKEAMNLTERDEVEVEGGAKYKGQWCGNVRQGHGVIIQPDGSRYEGHFHDGQASGHGSFVATNGNKYDGEWLHNRAHGNGRSLFYVSSVFSFCSFRPLFLLISFHLSAFRFHFSFLLVSSFTISRVSLSPSPSGSLLTTTKEPLTHSDLSALSNLCLSFPVTRTF